MQALARVAVVLVRPARPANVGAACRALKNMGLSRLRLVDAAIDANDPAARAGAYGAWDLLDAAERFATLPEATADCMLVAATSGRAHAGAWDPARFAAEAARAPGPVALVFGPEASGLTNDELRLCHARVRIDADPAQPSLNLAQAVLLLAYEVRKAAGGASPLLPEARRATAGELEEALGALRDALLAVGYLSAQNPDAVLGELRALLARAAPTPREVSLLRGLARQVRWAGGRIAGGGQSDP